MTPYTMQLFSWTVMFPRPTPVQTRHLHSQERSILVAARVIRQQCFLQVVKHQNQGSSLGRDTDEPMERGDADDPPVEDGPFTMVVNNWRDGLNHALARAHFRDAAELQQLVFWALENISAGNRSRAPEKDNVLRELSNKLESVAPRHQMLTPAIAKRSRLMANSFQNWMLRDVRTKGARHR